MQNIKWPAEGTVKGFGRVFRDVMTCVNGRRYVGILQSVCVFFTINQGGTAKEISSLAVVLTARAFLLPKTRFAIVSAKGVSYGYKTE